MAGVGVRVGVGGAQASQGKGPLPTLTLQSSIRHVRPGALPRGQCLPGLAVWWSLHPGGKAREQGPRTEAEREARQAAGRKPRKRDPSSGQSKGGA